MPGIHSTTLRFSEHKYRNLARQKKLPTFIQKIQFMSANETPSYLLSTANSTRRYYKSINNLYLRLFGKHLMLHYPYYKSDFESLETRQLNLTDYCLSHIESLAAKRVLEVGCGNGIQALYIADSMSPSQFTGIDLNPDNITIANQNKGNRENIDFSVDDAQRLATVADNSVDVLICVESAFHYPQKELFLVQVRRVLKPSGKFVITDIINKSPKRKYITQKWKNKMEFHHWTEAVYLQSFAVTGLNIDYKENITSQILKGYQGSLGWITRGNSGSFLSFLLFKVFAVIQLGINTNLLKKKEDYILFVGSPVK